MDLLTANDRPGQYPESWYAATADFLPPQPPARGGQLVDICVIGAGYTGLSAALHLADMGYKVALLEAQRIGFGASGRNGGQLGSGQRMTQDVLEQRHGLADARKLWQLGEEAKALVKDLISRHDIDCQLKPGVVWAGSSKRAAQELQGYATHLQDHYGYGAVEALDNAALEAICPSPIYQGGLIDHDAAHLHPLNYALGLARSALKAGVRLYEQSRVARIEQGTRPVVHTTEGARVTCDFVILAANGYLGDLAPQVTQHVMPINNFIAATRPLSASERDQVLRQDVAVADSRFVVNYFRLSPDNRLLFGGGESYGYRFPKDIAAKARRPMAQIFPQLRDVEIDYAWGGTLAITRARMPYLTRLTPNILSASGYSGHGIGTATHAGQLMAQTIDGQAQGFEIMASLPTPAFPGGNTGRSSLLALAMTWYSLRDRLGI